MKPLSGNVFFLLMWFGLLVFPFPSTAYCSNGILAEKQTKQWNATYFIKHPISGMPLGTRTVSVTTGPTEWSIREHQVFHYDQEILEQSTVTVLSAPPTCQLRTVSVETRLGGVLLDAPPPLSMPHHPFEPPMIPLSVLALLSSAWISENGFMDNVTIVDRPVGIRGLSAVSRECVVIRLRRCRDDRLSLHVMKKDGREIALMLLDEEGRMTHEINQYAISVRSDQENADAAIPEELLNQHEKNLRRSSTRLPRLF